MQRAGYVILAHNNPSSVQDQIDAIQAYEPGSPIILYNGGHDKKIFSDLSVRQCRYSRPIQWGRGLELVIPACARQWIEDGVEFDWAVSVDSDMQMIRGGFSSFLKTYLTNADYMAAYVRTEPMATVQLWTRRLYDQLPLWKDILGTPPYLAVYNPGQVVSRARLEEMLFAPPSERLYGELQRTRLNCLEEFVLPNLVRKSGGHVRTYPPAQEKALFGEQTTSTIAWAAAQPDVFFVHKVPLSMESAQRRLLVQHREGTLGLPEPEEPCFGDPITQAMRTGTKVRLGSVYLRSMAMLRKVFSRQPRLDGAEFWSMPTLNNRT